jgi:protein TonB
MRPLTVFAAAMCALAIVCGAPASALAAKQKPAAKAPAPTTPAPAPAARPDSTVPERVDILPEQLTQPAPEYPKAAIDAHIQGIVAVMAHVLADGTVGETHVLKSIPALDSAAVQSVRRLRFKPASRQGKPVAVWLGVPVRFTIH